jgi:hypothetical protein
VNRNTRKELLATLRELYPERRPHKTLTVEQDGIEYTTSLDELSYIDYCTIVDMFELNSEVEK